MNRWLSFGALLTLNCAGALPAPERTTHPPSSYLELPYPPPAALAEEVPEPPSATAVVWLDGEWTFHGASFVWRRGGWVIPPRMGRFAPWRVWYQRDGRLMMASGTWYDAQGRVLRAPATLRPALTPANETTSEVQTGR